ncbi:hypothetical protein [Streptomyces nigrescens]|uniref:hypothetical protein n=1 Tax=Streptomyces nigrescens TaxID=1920 RepID=UPI003701F7DB
MPAPVNTLFTVGAVILGLGLVLRVYRNSSRPPHAVVIGYGAGTCFVALAGAVILELIRS